MRGFKSPEVEGTFEIFGVFYVGQATFELGRLSCVRADIYNGRLVRKTLNFLEKTNKRQAVFPYSHHNP